MSRRLTVKKISRSAPTANGRGDPELRQQSSIVNQSNKQFVAAKSCQNLEKQDRAHPTYLYHLLPQVELTSFKR